MNRNQVNDPREEREEAEVEAGEAAGNNPSNTDPGRSGATRKATGSSRLRFGWLKDYIVKTM